MFKSFKQTLTALACSCLLGGSLHADLLIAPTRVVLERGERTAELVVVNKGQEEFAFRVSLENRRMRLDGSFEDADTALEGENFASGHVRFSPRRLVLAPDERQTLRISANTAGLEPGEYRSHLRLMSAPMSAGQTLARAASPEQDGISIELVAVRSVTIPVIIRVGSLDASVEINSIDLREGNEADETLLVARLSREGNRSTYGDIELYADNSDEPVYFARGVAIYTPNAERDVILPIPTEIVDSLRGHEIRLAYISSDPANPETLAQLRTVLD